MNNFKADGEEYGIQDAFSTPSSRIRDVRLINPPITTPLTKLERRDMDLTRIANEAVNLSDLYLELVSWFRSFTSENKSELIKEGVSRHFVNIGEACSNNRNFIQFRVALYKRYTEKLAYNIV